MFNKHVLVIAALFLAASAAVNTLFAMSIGTTPQAQALFIAFGLGSTSYKAISLNLIKVQWQNTEKARSVAAFTLLAITILYDGAALRGFTAAEMHTLNKTVATTGARQTHLKADIETARKRIADYSHVPAYTTTQARLKALRLNPAKCAGRLKWRYRTKCKLHDKLKISATQALERDRVLGHLKTLESRSRVEFRPATGDSRQDYLPKWLILLLPVLLVEAGTLLSSFSAYTPKRQKSSPAPTEKPRHQVVPSMKTENGIADDLRALIQKGDSPGLETDGSTLVGPQRKIASALNVSTARLNRDLQQARDAGAISVDTSNRCTRVKVLN